MTKSLKLVLALLAALMLLATAVTACGGDDDDEAVIGYISLGDSVPFVKLVSDSVQREADAAGLNLVVCDSEIDPAKALECAQLMGQRDVDVVLNFQVFQESSPEICAAYDNVPTIAIDIVQDPCEVAFMGADNQGAGELAGSAIGAFIKENFDCEYDAYVSLESTAAGAANQARMGGYRSGFTQHCPLVNARVMDGADRTDTALEQMTDLLPALPGERIVVVAINEDGIIGALAAARTLGREGDLYYSGQGTDPSIWCDIRDNPNYVASTAYFPERYGEILIPAAQAILDGEEVAENLFTEHIIINSENIESIYEVTDCG
ncbi:sugar ABC transporter substrate-binding protein [Candidatus Poriferisocius sp.]|uniref:sugar ABC transporter substrate-binding protein n=1 Tax=Candidatus Poriferisocius sp. TaxID=3101276 RepID=UPI003B5B6650